MTLPYRWFTWSVGWIFNWTICDYRFNETDFSVNLKKLTHSHQIRNIFSMIKCIRWHFNQTTQYFFTNVTQKLCIQFSPLKFTFYFSNFPSHISSNSLLKCCAITDIFILHFIYGSNINNFHFYSIFLINLVVSLCTFQFIKRINFSYNSCDCDEKKKSIFTFIFDILCDEIWWETISFHMVNNIVIFVVVFVLERFMLYDK